jgi:hypothetical protein
MATKVAKFEAFSTLKTPLFVVIGPGGVADYSDWLRAGGSRDQIPVGRNFPHLSRPALRPTQPPVQWKPGLSRG